MKNIIFWFCLLLIPVLNGCAPKERNINGQVFIVTRDAQSIKLGLVDVLVLDENPAKEWAQKALAKLKSERDDAKRKLDTAQKDSDSYEATNATTTASFTEMKKENEDLKKKIEKTDQYLKGLDYLTKEVQKIKDDEEEQRAHDPLGAPLIAAKKMLAVLEAQEEIQKQMRETVGPPDKCGEIILRQLRVATKIDAVYKPYLTNSSALKQAFKDAESRFQAADFRLNTFPSASDYTTELPRIAFSKATTDADGKFILKIPTKGRFAVFAQAKRLVGESEELYTWFCWLPDKNPQEVFLMSNNNLCEVKGTHNIVAK